MASSPRFLLYIMAASDGKSIGDCPFSQRVLMYSRLKVPLQEVELVLIDTSNKPPEFLKLNPDGKVPVLIDRQNENKIIPDSGEITAYINEKFPKPDLQQLYDGPGLKAASGVFPKTAALIMNQDPEKEKDLKAALTEELRKLNDYLGSADRHGKYLLCDDFCEIDCMILPRLRHLQVAAKHYRNFDIPAEFTALHQYISDGNSHEVFKDTCCPDEEIIKGWGKYLS